MLNIIVEALIYSYKNTQKIRKSLTLTDLIWIKYKIEQVS